MNLKLLWSNIIILLLLSANSMQAQYFTPVWEGQNPYQSMAIIITSAQLDGVNLQVGDSVAVLDIEDGTGNLICVGADTVDIPGKVIITAGGQDPSGDPQGFTNGNEIIILIWNSSESKIISLINPSYSDGFNDIYQTLGTAVLTLESYSLNEWNGTTDSDWHSGANWSSGMVTDSLADVKIPFNASRSGEYPELSTAGECHNFVIEATTDGSASILGNDLLSVSGTAIVETSISADKWHIVSPPVDNQIADVFYLDGDPKVFLMDYNEANEEYNYITDVNTELNNMQGYMVWANSTRQMFSYSGNLNSGDFGSADNLTRNASGSAPGWNMVGNPYPSAIDWEVPTGWTKTNLDDAVYIINNGIWASYVNGVATNEGSRYISTGQGFFVRVADGQTTGTLKMTDEVRVNNNTPFLKNQRANELVKLAVNGVGWNDETVIYFNALATANFDGAYDAFKRFSTDTDLPQLFTFDEEEYSINCLPALASVNMGFVSDVDGEYTISIVESESLPEIWLEDVQESTYTNLLVESYSFYHEMGNDQERFVVHFSAVSVNEIETANIRVYGSNKQVNIRSNKAIEGEIVVINILGQRITNEIISGTSANIKVEKSGYYIVRVISDGKALTQKVFVK